MGTTYKHQGHEAAMAQARACGTWHRSSPGWSVGRGGARARRRRRECGRALLARQDALRREAYTAGACGHVRTPATCCAVLVWGLTVNVNGVLCLRGPQLQLK